MTRIAASAAREVLAHAGRAAPVEACGLIGRNAAGLRLYVPCANIADSPLRYAVAPAEVLRALRLFEARGLALGAVFHSHPAGEALPSAADRAEAAWPDVLHLIAAPRARRRLRAFWLSPGEVREEPLRWG